MKYCPVCEREYEDSVATCAIDGGSLRSLGARQDPWIGKIVKGRYEVLKKLGEGGMGAVYLAELVSIRKKVALKVLHDVFSQDDEFVRRFRQEARVAGSLNHRNIVSVFDFDQAEDGRLFIGMEYVGGMNLAELIAKGPLELDLALHIGIQAAEGLGAAHSAGVIHRDIKPQNIMVASGEDIKIMDFGIARLRDSETTRLTRPGIVMGTPAYMAPEQQQAEDNVTERTDIYALGVVLYEMLTGDVPFKASTSGGILLKHLAEKPMRPRKIRAGIPRSVERVILQALEKDPQSRQASMSSLAEGLRQAQTGLIQRFFSGVLGRGNSEGKSSLPGTGEFQTESITKEEDKSLTKVSRETDRPSSFSETQAIDLKRKSKVGRKRSQYVPLSAMVALLLLAVGFGTYKYVWPIFTGGPAIVSLKIVSDATELAVNERKQLKAIARYSDGNAEDLSKAVQWKSNDLSVLKADNSGVIEGFKKGSAEIVAVHGNTTSPPLLMTITDQPDASSQVVEFSIRVNKNELLVGERINVSAIAKHADGNEKKIDEGVLWQSSDPLIASVSRDGEVEGQKKGDVRVIATYRNVIAGPVTLRIKARQERVVPKIVSLQIRANARTLYVKQRMPLTVRATYSDGSEKNLTRAVEWESSDQAVAVVSSKGELEGKAEGEVAIKARYDDIVSAPLTLLVERATAEPQPQQPTTSPEIAHGLYGVLARTPVLRYPQPDAEVLARLYPGLQVRVVGRRGDYFELQRNREGSPGYVLRKDLVFLHSE